MVRGRACALVACGVVAVALLGAVSGAPASVASVRSPHCSEITPPPQPDVRYREFGYRQIVLRRSWLRVGARLGVGHGPGDPGGPCGPTVCTPLPPPPMPEPGRLYPGGFCTVQPRPPTPGPAIAVSQLRAFPPSVALSRGGSSRTILVAEGLCRFASERMLLRCMRSHA